MTSRRLRMAVTAVVLAATVPMLGGCGTLKKFTGQRNDTVLPGQREDILTPEQTKRQDPNVSGGQTAQQPADTTDIPCDPTQQDCSGGIDQEAGGFEG